jgi:hypothetical protein
MFYSVLLVHLSFRQQGVSHLLPTFFYQFFPDMKTLIILLFTLFFVPRVTLFSQIPDDQKLAEIFESITIEEVSKYCEVLTSDAHEGRLSGSPGFWKSADYLAGLLGDWGIQPAGEDGSYFQSFPCPYTEVVEAGRIVLSTADGNTRKEYHFPMDFYPGSNTASGAVQGEAVYVGFGISAPELGYDDYKGVDVKGKIVVFEPGLPVNPSHPDYSKWVPYSYHKKKFSDAQKKGVAGMLYADKIVNPNTSHLDGFVYAHAGKGLIDDLFSDTETSFEVQRSSIIEHLRPQSIPLKRHVSIHVQSSHFPDAKACNVIGMIPGSDPVLKNEVILIGGHFDGQGKLGDLVFPGALDNASGVANVLAAARAISIANIPTARTILFFFIGGEENGLLGSSYYVHNPAFPRESTLVFFNLDMVGNGTGIRIMGGESYPLIFRHFEKNNFAGRNISASSVRPVTGRPRSDAAIFQMAGYRTMGIGTTGRVKDMFYHDYRDDMMALTPDIMRDVARLIFLSLIDLANDREISIY